MTKKQADKPKTEFPETSQAFFERLPFKTGGSDFDVTVTSLKTWNKSQEDCKVKLAFTLLAIKESETFRTLKYKDMDSFIREELGMHKSGAARLLSFAKRYKELGVPPELANTIRFHDFNKLATRVNQGFLTQAEAIDTFIPCITTTHDKCISSEKFEELLDAKVEKNKTPENHPPIHLGTFRNADANILHVNCAILADLTEFDHNADQAKNLNYRTIVLDAVIKAAQNFAHGAESSTFTNLHALIELLNQNLLPGLSVSLDIYDSEALNETIELLSQKYLPKNNEESETVAQVQIDKFVQSVCQDAPKYFFNAKTQTLYKGVTNPDTKTWTEITQVQIATSLLSDNAHMAFQKNFEKVLVADQPKKVKAEAKNYKKKMTKQSKEALVAPQIATLRETFDKMTDRAAMGAYMSELQATMNELHPGLAQKTKVYFNNTLLKEEGIPSSEAIATLPDDAYRNLLKKLGEWYLRYNHTADIAK